MSREGRRQIVVAREGRAVRGVKYALIRDVEDVAVRELDLDGAAVERDRLAVLIIELVGIRRPIDVVDRDRVDEAVRVELDPLGVVVDIDDDRVSLRLVLGPRVERGVEVVDVRDPDVRIQAENDGPVLEGHSAGPRDLDGLQSSAGVGSVVGVLTIDLEAGQIELRVFLQGACIADYYQTGRRADLELIEAVELARELMSEVSLDGVLPAVGERSDGLAVDREGAAVRDVLDPKDLRGRRLPVFVRLAAQVGPDGLHSELRDVGRVADIVLIREDLREADKLDRADADRRVTVEGVRGPVDIGRREIELAAFPEEGALRGIIGAELRDVGHRPIFVVGRDDRPGEVERVADEVLRRRVAGPDDPVGRDVVAEDDQAGVSGFNQNRHPCPPLRARAPGVTGHLAPGVEGGGLP